MKKKKKNPTKARTMYASQAVAAFKLTIVHTQYCVYTGRKKKHYVSSAAPTKLIPSTIHTGDYL